MKNLRLQSLQARLIGPLIILLIIFTIPFGYLAWSFRGEYIALSKKLSLNSEVSRHVVEITRIRANIQEVLFNLQLKKNPAVVEELRALNEKRSSHLDRIRQLTQSNSRWESLGNTMVGGIKDAAFLQYEMIEALESKDARRADIALRQLSTIFEINSARLKDFTLKLENDLQENAQDLQLLLLHTFWSFVGIVGLVAVGVWGIAWLYRRQVLYPLKRLHNGFQSLSRGEMNSQIKIEPMPRELREMTTDFNKMTKDLHATQLDLTRAREDALSAAKIKSDFLANMSHEIRTPLNTIVGVSDELIEMQTPSTQKDYTQILNKSAQVLLSIVNDILDFSKLEDGSIKLANVSFDLNELTERISSVVAPMARKKNLQFEFQFFPNTPCWVSGDPKRIEQIVLNLLGNAIKFTESGKVQIHIGSQIKGNRNFILMQVNDTGVGIPEADIGKIFERFTQSDVSLTRRHGGTGLGLSIVKQLVGLMNGSVKVQSKVGEGSWFSVELELPTAEAAIALEPSRSAGLHSESEISKTKKSILLVDDSSENRALIQIFLRKTFHEITTAEDGAEAVAHFEKKKFDLILMDMQMPVMDGYEATRKIRQLEKARGYETIPIIALSAYSMPEEIERGRLAGCDDYLTKPLRKSELMKALDDLLRK